MTIASNYGTSITARGGRLRRVTVMTLALIVLPLSTVAFTAAPAGATAETCISASSGIVCTKVWGSGTYVQSIRSSKNNWNYASFVCNYSAWFFYIPPTGGAYGLGYQSRQGCTLTPAWLIQPVYRSFPRNTLICAKFFQDNGVFVGEKCVGVS